MIKLVLKDEEYDLPTNFSEINIEVFKEVNKVITEEKTPIERMVKIISILTGLPSDIIRQIDMNQINIINHTLEFMFKKSEYPLKETFEIDGVLYGLNKDLGKINFGEWIDLETFSKNMNDLNILMSVLYRPVTSWNRHKWFNWLFKGIKSQSPTYKIQDYGTDDVLDRAKLFNEKMTMDIVWGSMFFFIILAAAYTLHLKGYTEKQMIEEIMKMMEGKMI